MNDEEEDKDSKRKIGSDLQEKDSAANENQIQKASSTPKKGLGSFFFIRLFTF